MHMRWPTTSRRHVAGLTYGEMLIVLVVFALLAAMFILSSKFALVKTRMSRVMQEQKMVAQAIGQFNADRGFVPSDQQGLNQLVRPYTYITQVPIDPFRETVNRRESYRYYSNISTDVKAFIISAGPDATYDLPPVLDAVRVQRSFGVPNLRREPLLRPFEVRQVLVEFAYDPTNGTISAGDIIYPYQ